jgi:DNA-binding transcriptional regulator YiaG
MMEREFSKKCSKCGERAMAIATVPYELQIDHDGQKYQVTISDFTVPKCTKCANISHDAEASEQISLAFRRQAGLLQPDEIRRRRESLGLPQQAVADMLAVPVSKYTAWETGELIQTRSQDRFLRAFFVVPELRKTLADSQALKLAPIAS